MLKNGSKIFKDEFLFLCQNLKTVVHEILYNKMYLKKLMKYSSSHNCNCSVMWPCNLHFREKVRNKIDTNELD